jgi:hypothetical protein
MSAAATQSTTHEVCLSAESTVTQERLCEHCGIKAVTRKFCSPACRQANHRQSPAHQANITKQKAMRLGRRNRWVAAKIRDKSLGFDGRFGGHDQKGVPPLGDFERTHRYNEDAQMCQEINESNPDFALDRKSVTKQGVVTYRLREMLFESTLAHVDAKYLGEVLRRVGQSEDVVSIVYDVGKKGRR